MPQMAAGLAGHHTGDARRRGMTIHLARLEKHRGFFEKYLAEMQDRGRLPRWPKGFAQHIRTFYSSNDTRNIQACSYGNRPETSPFSWCGGWDLNPRRALSSPP